MNKELQKIQLALPATQPKNFCVAPFLSTMQTPYGKTSPCAYGITEWLLTELTPEERWQGKEYNEFRLAFATGHPPEPCTKCFNEEQGGKDSLRLRMLDWYKDSYEKFILTGEWQQGPKHVSTKVSNICNIACRSCAGWDSNFYQKEGDHYLEKYNTQYNNKSSNRFIPQWKPKHTDYKGFEKISNNVVHLEFYGGEPLLNLTHLDYLEYLIETGQSKNITIFYSTNCTQPINPRFIRIWNQFKKLQFNLSIDHIEDKFEYLRWPANWNEVYKNIQDIINLKNKLNVEVSQSIACCATVNNGYYIDEIIKWADEHVGCSYINMVAFPHYLPLHIIPESVKEKMLEHVKCPEVKGFMKIKTHNPIEWKHWLIWTKRQDLYRNQNFATIFPEFHSLIEDDWNLVTDLSEEFYQSEMDIYGQTGTQRS